jgi:hypothetical protein
MVAGEERPSESHINSLRWFMASERLRLEKADFWILKRMRRLSLRILPKLMSSFTQRLTRDRELLKGMNSLSITFPSTFLASIYMR